jgi:hypothetical protein
MYILNIGVTMNGDFSRFQLHHFHRICTGEPHVSATGYACPDGFKLTVTTMLSASC